MLQKLNVTQYPDLIDCADAHDCGAVYPLSVACGIQAGDIFTDSVKECGKVLFWTHSGFAYLAGSIDEDFLAKGKGYCITCNADIASWAFSAAVSTKEIDIGIETKPEYKQQGLGMIVVNKMIQYTLEQGKEPVWACHYKNTASEKMAEKLGFVKVSECSAIKSKE